MCPLWDQMVHQWETHKKKDPIFIRDMVRRGIPSHYRGIVWQYLCDAQLPPSSPGPTSATSTSSLNPIKAFLSDSSQVNGNGSNGITNGSMNGSSCSPTLIRSKYMDYLKSSSPCEKIIRRDIARTFPEIEYFREERGAGQAGLFNVMKAYSVHDSEVGYCQGSAFLVGLLLMQMPEEDAFAILVKMMEDYRLREMYKPTMAELGLCIYQLECLVQVSRFTSSLSVTQVLAFLCECKRLMASISYCLSPSTTPPLSPAHVCEKCMQIQNQRMCMYL